MKLKHLVISNCSRIKDLDIDVRDNLVLIGPNGSGKTTVLLCLEMLLGMDEQRLRETISKGFISDDLRPFSVEALFSDLSTDELAAFPEEANAQNAFELAIRLEVTVADGSVTSATWSFPCSETAGALSQAQRDAIGWSLLQTQAGLRDNERSSGPQALFSVAIYDLLISDANILAIDEPELHLHPSSQRSLAKLLRTGRSQKILVTHSPTIAGSFEPDEIVVIRADGQAVQPKKGFLRDDAGMLARWWIGRQLEPLTARIVIAVEGPSDRIIVNQVADSMGFDLDLHDIVVIETDGCGDMKSIKAVFGKEGFDIPLFVLVDEDARKDTAKRFGADPENPADLEAHGVFISFKDLEDEYVQAIGPRKLWDKLRAGHTFSETAFRQCNVEPDGYPSASDLAMFIRSKTSRKIPAALVAASAIDTPIAFEVKSVARLLRAVSP